MKMEIVNSYYQELCAELEKVDNQLTFDKTDENFDALWEKAALLSAKVEAIRELMEKLGEE